MCNSKAVGLPSCKRMKGPQSSNAVWEVFPKKSRIQHDGWWMLIHDEVVDLFVLSHVDIFRCPKNRDAREQNNGNINTRRQGRRRRGHGNPGSWARKTSCRSFVQPWKHIICCLLSINRKRKALGDQKKKQIAARSLSLATPADDMCNLDGHTETC